MTDNNGSAGVIPAFPVELRVNPFKPELRAAEGDRPAHIVGYASVFNRLSRNLPGGFVERVNPAAFRSSQGNGWPGVICRFNHNDDFLLGTIAGRTLALDVDENGLSYDNIPPSFRSDIIELLRRGDVSSSSFAFRMPVDGGDDWQLSDWNQPLRTLLDLELIDVAPVTTPAYPDATSAARSIDGAIASLASKFSADPVEIRSLLDNKQAVKLFKRTDVRSAPPVTSPAVPEVPELEEARTKNTPEEEPMSLSGKNAAFYEEELRKDFSAADRKKLAKSGHAMPDGSFPIEDEGDLHNAIKLAGNASDPAAAKAHIKKRASALGKSDAIPDTWGSDSEKKSAEEEAEERATATPADKAASTKSKADAGADEDEDEDGSDSSGNGTEAEGRSDVETEEERAAKAGYDDLNTCGDCGAENQFGKHCENCGKAMVSVPKKGKYCPECGSKMPANRSEHSCDVEERNEEEQHQPAGTSDNGHKVSTADENRSRLLQLLEKRYDPYVDSDE